MLRFLSVTSYHSRAGVLARMATGLVLFVFSAFCTGAEEAEPNNAYDRGNTIQFDEWMYGDFETVLLDYCYAGEECTDRDNFTFSAPFSTITYELESTGLSGDYIDLYIYSWNSSWGNYGPDALSATRIREPVFEANIGLAGGDYLMALYGPKGVDYRLRLSVDELTGDDTSSGSTLTGGGYSSDDCDPADDFGCNSGTGSSLSVTLEEPAVGSVNMGVGNLRGWAVASAGIHKVEALLDGEFLGEIPYGGARSDVGLAFPDIDGSDQSGFSMAFNYSGLSAGKHTIEVVAHSTDNKTASDSAQFETVRFDKEFIGAGEAINLNAAASVLTNDQIQVENISIAGKYYNLLLRWKTAEQGFEIVEIEALDSGGSSSSDGNPRTFSDVSSTIDIGNAGNVQSSTVRLEIPERSVAAVGLSMSLNGTQEGRISFYPADSAGWAGFGLALWISETPDGASVSASCQYKGYPEGFLNFSLDDSQSCSLSAGEYFVNFAVCSSEPEDWNCSFDGVVLNDQDLIMNLSSKYR